MNIGIIIYSMSGHTAEAAKAIAARFRRENHDVDVKLLIATGMPWPGSRHFSISNVPDSEEIDAYDAIILGGPVWLFRASPVILKFESWLEKLNGKRLMNFVTQVAPWPSFGGEGAIRMMDRALKECGGTVLPGESIPYFFGFNKQRLNDSIEKIYKRIVEG